MKHPLQIDFVARLAIFAALSFACACSASAGDGTIYFEAEQPLLPAFEKDTGYLPAESPVQVRAVAQAGGGIFAAAEASIVDGVLSPRTGSGLLEVSAGFTFEVYANIDVSGVEYEGLVETVEYQIPAASTVFDPFLLEGEATTVTTELEPGELAEIPLASVPGGSLVLSIEGGTIATTFSGTCASARDDVAQYVGDVATSGQVVLAALVQFDVPVVGTKQFGPFSIPVDIPATSVTMDLGVRDSGDNAVDGPGPCVGGGDGDGDGDGGGGGGGGHHGGGDGDGDAENCGLPPSLGDLGVRTSGKALLLDGVLFSESLEGVTPSSAVSFYLRDGFGVFGNGYAPGLYTIAGDDTDMALCGNCVFVGVDVGQDGRAARYLMAESGTATIVELDPTPNTGRVAVTYSNIVLREVTIDENNRQHEVADGCRTRLGSYSVDIGIVK